ncbi:helix-turn-helix transcriptional regulator [Parvularcula flava]|uniref:Transcriptional regulator n=1 Tax=Aquisalinus luteolus TaxID=1566827 RepID=A0A8J3A5W2_9PROT|nr:helix-turn-helix transcriptional regulator [Aquisalinus luteolus]GGH94591.1 transcriptional regulator [Aquisalinus luteolus]
MRQSRGLTQAELGQGLGVSLQQVQKYESGRNRMAASTVYRAARILGVEVAAFYADLHRDDGGEAVARPVMVIPLGDGSAPARKAELIELVGAYQGITDTSLRASVRRIVRRLSCDPGGGGSCESDPLEEGRCDGA